MFGDKVGQGIGGYATAAPSTANEYYGQQAMANANRPIESGIASRVQSLVQSASDTRELVFNLRAALGLGCPPDKAVEQPSTLADVLSKLRCDLDSANQDLRDVIGHINS